MRTSRLISAAVSLALLGLPAAVATASTASAGETYSTEVSIALSKNVMRYANTFTVRGQVGVTMPDGTKLALPDASVTLQRRFPGKSWASIAKTTSTSTDAVYTFSGVKAVQNASYRTTYAGETRSFPEGDETFTASTSTVRSIRVARVVDTSGVKRSGRIYFLGKVTPTYRGKVVDIQRRTCGSCAWRLYKEVRTNKYSRFRLEVPGPRKGSWYYRARTPKTTSFIASTGSTIIHIYTY